MTIAPVNHEVIARWEKRLRVLSSDLHLPTQDVDALAYLDGFTDGMGDRRAIDAPLLARMLRNVTCHHADNKHFEASVDDDAAVALMKAAGRDDVDAALSLVRSAIGSDVVPLVAHPLTATLEAQTELELAAAHGLGVLALRHAATHPHFAERLLGAVRWLMAEIQPDNATNRPWAVHAFVWAASRQDGGAVDAEMYADTLVHNALVAGSTQPRKLDVFSGLLLRDSAEVLADLSRQFS